MKKNIKLGFTLAEVLITLGIIGVVAAMTIPTLMANYKKNEYVVGLKKAYSQTNQALIALTNDQNTPGDLKATGLFPDTGEITNFGDEFVKQFKVVKNYGTSALELPNNVSLNAASDGSNTNIYTYFSYYDGSGQYCFTTADGMFFALSAYGDCASNFSTGASGHLTQVCGELDVDVNGFKPPNFFGRDIFRFYISNGKGAFLYPYSGIDDNRGYWKDNDYCVNIATGMDVACAARIIDEGWQMNY